MCVEPEDGGEEEVGIVSVETSPVRPQIQAGISAVQPWTGSYSSSGGGVV